MRYGIRQMVLGNNHFFAMSAERYSQIVKASKLVIDALSIAEKHRILSANYAEFEHEMLRLAANDMVFSDFTWGSMFQDMHEVARRLVNFLMTARLYVDHVKHDISRIYGNESTQFKDAKSAFSEQYDQFLGYRAMEAIRNFSQHQAIPVHSVFSAWHRTNSKVGDLVQHSCTPIISLIQLEGHDRFKASVLKELRTIANTKQDIDLKPLIREYMTGMRLAHLAVQQLMSSDVDNADKVLEETVAQAKKEFGGDLPGLAAVELDERGNVITKQYLLLEFIGRRKSLAVSKRDFRRQFLSSQIVDDMPDWNAPDQELNAELH